MTIDEFHIYNDDNGFGMAVWAALTYTDGRMCKNIDVFPDNSIDRIDHLYKETIHVLSWYGHEKLKFF